MIMSRTLRAVFPAAEVTGYETLIDGMTNHEKDRHVLAAAVRGTTPARTLRGARVRR